MTNARQFLPGIMPSTALAGNGPIAGYTPNYKLNLTNFDWITWHDYEWENWSLVDALLQTAIGFLNIVGIWKPNTAYIIGQTVYDPADLSKLYRCVLDHTSSTDPAQLLDTTLWAFIDQVTPPVTSVHGRVGDVIGVSQDYAAFYLHYRGVWIAGTYTVNQVVSHNGATWVVKVASTTQMPEPSASDWASLGGIGGATVSATPPVSPAAGQLWYCTVNPVGLYVYVADGDSSQWVAAGGNAGGGISQDAADARYLKLIGGTLTGALVLRRTVDTNYNPIYFNDAGGAPRWGLVHNNIYGGNFALNRYDTAGTYQNTPLEFSAANGSATFSAALLTLTSMTTEANIMLSGAITTKQQFTLAKSGLKYWGLALGENAAGNFYIQRSDDAGVTIDNPISISRATGDVNVSAALTANSTIVATGQITAGHLRTAGNVYFGVSSSYITSTAASGVLSWKANCYNEFNQSTHLRRWITDVSGTVTQSMVLTATGDLTIAANGWKPGGGTWAATSDARIKDVHGDFADGLEQVLALRPVTYSYKGNDTQEADGLSSHAHVAETRKTFVGFVAQEVECIMPVMVNKSAGFIDGVAVDDLRSIDTTPLIYALVNAIKELSAKVAQLEAKVV